MCPRTGSVLLAFAVLLSWAAPVYAQDPPPQYEWLCDSGERDCRQPVLDLIDAEDVAIDVAFWFMEDSRYVTKLINAKNRGVAVRILVDQKSNSRYPGNKRMLQLLKDGGLPMRERTTEFLHWKFMLFVEQGKVQFSGANYSPNGYVPVEPYKNYVDEMIYFTDDSSLVGSFKSKYDDVWTTTTGYKWFANPIAGPLLRSHGPAGTYPIDPEMNFPTLGGPSSLRNFAIRSADRYRAEIDEPEGVRGIDSIIYRIDDDRHTIALEEARAAGVPVRLITEQAQYRDKTRLMHSYHIDRLYMAGVQVRLRGHLGLTHEKLTILHGQRMSIFGSSNWTRSSADSQLEHNYFTTKPWIYDWTVAHFNRKWNNLGPSPESKPFVPLPPDTPSNRLPLNAAQGQPAAALTVRWYGGPWAHTYDVYLGTDPGSLTLTPERTNLPLGPSATTSTTQSYTFTDLLPETTYYWRIVSRTAANITSTGPVWSFRTEGPLPMAGPNDVVLYAGNATTIVGNWQRVVDGAAAGGGRLWNKNAGKAKPSTALAAPADYFELTFNAEMNVPYRLWVRGVAEKNSYANDSVFVQFSDSVNAAGTPTFGIGSTAGAAVSIEQSVNAGLQGWGWSDNAYGADAAPIYFATTGPHTIRIQRREDGISIDQIVLSRDLYLTTSPGFTKNDGTILQEHNPPLEPGS